MAKKPTRDKKRMKPITRNILLTLIVLCITLASVLTIVPYIKRLGLNNDISVVDPVEPDQPTDPVEPDKPTDPIEKPEIPSRPEFIEKSFNWDIIDESEFNKYFNGYEGEYFEDSISDNFKEQWIKYYGETLWNQAFVEFVPLPSYSGVQFQMKIPPVIQDGDDYIHYNNPEHTYVFKREINEK